MLAAAHCWDLEDARLVKLLTHVYRQLTAEQLDFDNGV